jgi:hypothetical protein
LIDPADDNSNHLGDPGVKLMIRKLNYCFAVLGSLFFPLVGLQAQSNATFFTSIRVMVHDIDGLREEYYENDPNLRTLTHHIEGSGTATATGQLGFGYNKVSASFDAYNFSNPTGMMMANGRTFWKDEVVIDSPGLTGTLGTFTASLRVEGNASFFMDGAYAAKETEADLYGFWDAWIGTSTDGGGSYLVGGWFGNWYSDHQGGTYYYGDDLNQPMTEVELEFIYGQPFLLGVQLEAYFDAQNPNLLGGTVRGSMDFSRSAYWNGINGFFDATGGSVQSVTLTSQSGIDWRLPFSAVPEPSSSLLIAMALPVLFRRRYRPV